MSTEFVVLDNGIETDHIDPVVSASETDKAWIVDNSYATYEIAKKPGRTILQRTKGNEGESDDEESGNE